MRTTSFSAVDLRVIERAVSQSNEPVFDNRKTAISAHKKLLLYRRPSFLNASFSDSSWPLPALCSGVSEPLYAECCSGVMPFVSARDTDGLKPDRIHEVSTATYFCLKPSQKGRVMVGDIDNKYESELCREADNIRKYPLGILLNDVVDLDRGRQHINYHRDEVQSGRKVSLLQRGQITTGEFVGKPQVGDIAYFTQGGQLTTQQGSQPVGRFLSTPSEGFVKVYIDVLSPAPPVDEQRKALPYFYGKQGFSVLDNRRVMLQGV